MPGSSKAPTTYSGLGTWRACEILSLEASLTHDDMTADLFLTISSAVAVKQLDGWSSKLFRDEVVGEWKVRQKSDGEVQYSLHLHCHVSGSHSFLAPPVIRSWIFEREMPLVLESIMYAEKALLASHPDLTAATVWIHYHSHSPSFDRADCWGPLHSSLSRSRDDATLLDVLAICLRDLFRWPFDSPDVQSAPAPALPLQPQFNPIRQLRPQTLALISRKHPEQVFVPLVLGFVYVLNCVFLMNVLAATMQ
ncbi:unnamed protein product [Closterium sp. Yama58-4]|nr:unnamed protein product [Closterium sp. Yama58-4]